MDVTLSGMIMVTSLLQLPKADSPIFVTLFGMEMDVRLVHPSNVELSIDGTLSGILIESSLLQCAKAEQPMVFTLVGMEIDVKLLHPSNV